MRIRTRVVRGGAWFGLLLAVGCEAAAATLGTIVVTVLRDSPPGPVIGAQVRIESTNTGAATNVSGKATLHVIPGTYTVRALMIGLCSATATAVVAEGQTTSITITLGSAPCSGPGGSSSVDRVSTGGTEPLYSLVDIRTGTAAAPVPCENDRLIEGTAGTAALLTNALTLSDPSVTCHGAAWVFTENHAPWFSNTAGVFPWTNSAGDVLTTTLPAGRLRVPVTFWLSDPLVNATTHTSKLTGTDLPAADGFFVQNRTGLRLTNSDAADTPPDIITVSPKVGSGCGDTPSIIASTAAYRVDHINVYVLDQLDGVLLGINCREYGAANVIFVDHKADFVTLVHEIGHALGLVKPQWGHADKLSGMHAGNFMWKGTGTPIHATLGQISRMHADPLSWLNQPSGTGTVRTRQPAFSLAPVTACSCPGIAATDDCPKVNADIARSGALSTPPLNPACHITADDSCLSLSTGATGTVTARGWTDVSALTPGSGIQMVASLTPTLVSAVATSASLGTVTASVTANTTPGVGKILLGIGGNLIEVPVKVGSSCP